MSASARARHLGQMQNTYNDVIAARGALVKVVLAHILPVKHAPLFVGLIEALIDAKIDHALKSKRRNPS